VPVAMRERYVQALVNSPRFGKQPDKRNLILAFCTRNGYRVDNVKLEHEEELNSLFLLPGKKPSDYLTGNPWDFDRRHRVIVEVTGIKWSYLAMQSA
jgi:hypothetical protein